MAQWEYQLSGDFLGATVTRMGRVSPPISLVQNRTGDFGAPFAHLRGSALQPLPQCTATVHAVHCIRPRKYVHPSLQVRASEIGFLTEQRLKICRYEKRKSQPLGG